MGMRAATGAISEVTRNGDGFSCRVIGGGEARGICGSGLVDAVAVALDLGLIEPDGRLALDLPRLASPDPSPGDRGLRPQRHVKGWRELAMSLPSARR